MSKVQEIYNSLISDATFEPSLIGKVRENAAWKVAVQKLRQENNNEKALTYGVEDEHQKHPLDNMPRLEVSFDDITVKEISKLNINSLEKFQDFIGENNNIREILNKPKENLGQTDPNQQNSNLYMQDKERNQMDDHPEEKTEELIPIDEDIMYDPKTNTYIIGTNIDYDPENYDWIRQARKNKEIKSNV